METRDGDYTGERVDEEGGGRGRDGGKGKGKGGGESREADSGVRHTVFVL